MIEGEELQIPPISLGQLRAGMRDKLREHDKLVADGDGYGALLLRGEILLETLRRNYPNFDEAKFYEFLNVENVGDIWLGVLGLSGFKPGETQAATATTSGT